jgi:ring-1,2-phenylacetyl-CoA epoxidase subunit PaaC
MTADAYDALTDHDDDARWAYGTGFADPLAGVGTTLPAPDPRLATRCLALGDDALILSHRLQQWCTRAPELEDELALANIALDLLGQARHLLTRAGAAEGAGRTEDDLAFGRDPAGFRHLRLAEGADPDFAHLVLRLLALSAWRLAVLTDLASPAGAVPADAVPTAPPDAVLAAIAAKGVKEVAYHRDYAARWVIRLGDGTALSHSRMQAAVDALWPLLGELELASAGPGWMAEVRAVLGQVLAAATLREPPWPPAPTSSGRDGAHTPALEEILGELQSVAREHPGGVW